METVTMHALKCYSEYFQAQAAGDKTFEVRKADRKFSVGDWIFLEETKQSPDGEIYKTGNVLYLVITYILPGGQYGIAPEYCILGTKLLGASDDDVIQLSRTNSRCAQNTED